MVSPSRPPRAAVSASIDFTQTDPRLSKQGNSYAQLVVELQLARQWQPYLFRVVVGPATLKSVPPGPLWHAHHVHAAPR